MLWACFCIEGRKLKSRDSCQLANPSLCLSNGAFGKALYHKRSVDLYLPVRRQSAESSAEASLCFLSAGWWLALFQMDRGRAVEGRS